MEPYDRKFNFSNSADFVGELSGEDLELIMTNSSDVQMKGEFKNVNLEVSNSASLLSEIEGDTLDAKIINSADTIIDGKFENVDIEASNSADFSGKLYGERLSMHLLNSAYAEVKGEFKEVVLKVNSSSEADLKGMNIEKADVDLSSSSDVTIGADVIDVSVTKSSQLNVVEGDVNVIETDKTSKIKILDE